MHRVIRYLELVLGERRFERARGILRDVSSATKDAVVTYSDRVRAEARAEAQREMLLKLLAQKFGALDDAVVARVRAADPSEVEAWLERFVPATRLDAVFES